MRTFFKINYEFDKKAVMTAINERLTDSGADYICVADGNILNLANRDTVYRRIINGGLFSICDSSYVPMYIRLIYGEKLEQYCGSQIFFDLVSSCNYKMIFLGANKEILGALKQNLIKINPQVSNMKFIELPFCEVNQFDYENIARCIEAEKADIIWVALGAPKQERFMSLLKPYLNHGIMIAVGAAFKFYSGLSITRAPKWMIEMHLEFLHRIYKEPKKQFKRCMDIIGGLPSILLSEWKQSRKKSHC